MSDDHHHTPADFNRAFAIGIVLNTGFVAIEAFYGWEMTGFITKMRDSRANLWWK